MQCSDLIVILRSVQYYIQKTNETIVHKKSIVLYILHNVVIKYTLKEQQIKASAESV